MQLAMIGLGRMGASMVRRPMVKGLECVVHDMRPSAVAALEKARATGATTLADLVAKTARPRLIRSAALDGRSSSRGQANFAHRVLSAMRHGFRGHVEKWVGGAT